VITDAEGRYLIPTVPIGIRTIEAANPASGARGSREVTLLTAGQASTGIDIVLEPLGTITGTVFDPQGRPVAGQEIRLLVAKGEGLAGRTFLVRKAVSGSDGSFTFTRVDAGTYPVIAVRGTEVANTTAVIASPLRSAVVTLRLVAPNGRASGRVVDEMGAPAAAKVSLKAMIPNAAGVLEFGDAGTIISDPDRGFTFTNIFPGPFTVTASSFFSAADATRSGRLSPPDPVADNIVLTLAANTARVGGCVLNPDGSPLQPLRRTDGA